jgi:hypothetical protein
MANGVKFGRKPKLSPFQRAEAIKRRAAGETLASIAKSYAVDISMTDCLPVPKSQGLGSRNTWRGILAAMVDPALAASRPACRR